MLALLLALAALADVPPPPPPLDAPEAAAPPVDDPAPVAPPVAPDPDGPAPLAPLPDADEGPRPQPPPRAGAEAEGLDPFLVGLLQWLVPCATAAVAAPCTLIGTYACPLVICVPCVLPAVNGYLATYLGDRWGTTRAPAIWPVLASYGSAAVAAAAVVGVYVVTLAAAGGGGGDLSNPVLLGGLGVALLVGAGATLAVPVSYALTAEPKRAGDDGSATPGWFAPNHPAPRKQRPREPADAPPRFTAMRF